MCFPPFLGAQPDPEREADRPIAHNDAAVVINHEDRPVCLRPVSEDVRHLVVAIEDRFDDAQFGDVLVQRRLVAAEDQRYPFVGVNKAGGGDERSSAAINPSIALMPIASE